jgi:tyrosine-protein kinase Etk/Wzc
MSNESSSVRDGFNAAGTPEPEYRTINLSGFVLAVIRRKKIVFGFALAGLVLAAVVSYMIRPRYDAEVRFLPPAEKGILPVSLFPTKNPGDHYLGLVSSRAVADDVIEHQHLLEYFHAKKLSDARRRLSSISTIAVDKDQFVTVKVRATESQTAVNIANEYLAALYRLNNAISIAEAKHRWEFYETPLEEEKDKLAAAEEDLEQAQQKTGMVLPEAQARIGLSALAELKQQIAIREVQLASLRTGGTDQNPHIIRLKSQISNLHAQVERMQQQTGGQGTTASASQLPALAMEVERKTREVKFHETLFGILSRQYENARVDQSYTPSIELVDRAVLPDEKSWPPRKILMICGLIGGGLLGILFVGLQRAEIPRRWKNFLVSDDSQARADALDV